jgi:hypothetical protein
VNSCGPTPDETISDLSGRHQLSTRWVAEGEGHNFDALVWRTREGDSWVERCVIRRQDFEVGSDRRRWISGLGSFDPLSGHAIIRVAEGDAPRGSRHVHYIYSWREWSVVENRQVRYICTCETPFDDFPVNKA